MSRSDFGLTSIRILETHGDCTWRLPHNMLDFHFRDVSTCRDGKVGALQHLGREIRRFCRYTPSVRVDERHCGLVSP